VLFLKKNPNNDEIPKEKRKKNVQVSDITVLERKNTKTQQV